MNKNIHMELNPSNKGKKQKLRRDKKRKLSSTNWISRQLNDPYVIEANRLGYNSRSAFKLMQIDAKFNFLKPGKKVIDLGCAPGGWLQVAAKKVNSSDNEINVVGVDILPVKDIYGVKTLTGDVNDISTENKILNLLKDKPDIVLSDMAANTSGNKYLDSYKTGELCLKAMDLSTKILNSDGVFLSKIFMGSIFREINDKAKRHFKKIVKFKPLSSKKESKEIYIFCRGIKEI